MIAVLTCKREGADYLADTLADVDSSATGRRIVVTDTTTWTPPILPVNWEIVAFEKPTERRENKWALWKCFEVAVQLGEDLIVLEDDIRLCKNAARRMERAPVPDDVAFVSFYDPWFDDRPPHGWWRSRCHVFMYAQALKFPWRTVVKLHEARQRMAEDSRRGGSDDLLQILGDAFGWTYAIHVPGLVQHVDGVSAVGNKPAVGRVSRSFRGATWDALTCHHTMYL